MSFPPTARAVLSPNSAQDPIPLLLRDLVHEHTGTHFDAERIGLMLEKLQPRLAATGSRGFLEYFYLLKYDDKAREEWRRVMDAFAVQETYFWREFDQIQTLVDVIVPAWFKQTAQPFRLWSAACATGEEPYSIAIALQEAGWGNHPIEIYASDASELALAKAQAGIYRTRSFRVLPDHLREKYFTPIGESYALKPEITSRVTFHWANLVALPEVTVIPVVQVIFCRNVFIYFSPTMIKRVLPEFAKRLTPHGHLFVGASESLLKLTTQFDLQEMHRAFVYTRLATT